MNSTETYSEMIDGIEALSDEDLAKELSFAEGFGPSDDDEAVNVWLEALRHESRCRGVFVPEGGFTEIGAWLYDSDYAIAPDVGWINVDTGLEIVPEEVYAEAHQSMTWADALDNVLNA